MWRLADVIAILEASISNYGQVVLQSTEQAYYCVRNKPDEAMASILTELLNNINCE